MDDIKARYHHCVGTQRLLLEILQNFLSHNLVSLSANMGEQTFLFKFSLMLPERFLASSASKPVISLLCPMFVLLPYSANTSKNGMSRLHSKYTKQLA